MRAGLLLLALLACSTPALAQKNPPPASGPSAPAPSAPAATGSVATDLAGTCLKFARGDADAEASANSEGWGIELYGTDDNALKSMSGSRSIAGIGDANIFGSFETYPKFSLRFCRVDVTLNADAGPVNLEALSGWEGVAGAIRETDAGTYGSWDKTETDPDRLYLVLAQQEGGVIVQVTVITSNGDL
jgi:hypothetical protein